MSPPASRFALLALLALVAISAVSAAPTPAFDGSPVGLSPGSDDGIADISTSCPTFSWTTSETGREVELLLWEVEAVGGSSERPRIERRFPAGSTSWSPSTEDCLAPGVYGWAVRSIDAPGARVEPTILLFRVVGGMTLDEARSVAAAPAAPETLGGPEAQTSEHQGSAARPPDLPGIGGSSSSRGLPASTAAIRGENAATSDAAMGVLGVSHSSDGAGLSGENLAGGWDLRLDGTAAGQPHAHLTEQGLVREGAGVLTYDFTNPDPTGTMMLRVDGAEVVTTATDQDALSALSCSSGQVAKWNGSNWDCGDDQEGAGGGTTVVAGNELFFDGSTLHVDEGPGSGLDADTVDGLQASQLALASHGHAGSLWATSSLQGLWITTDATNGQAILGTATNTVGTGGFGVKGEAAAPGGTGVVGQATSTTGSSIGVAGSADSSDGIGVEGTASATTGFTAGVKGVAVSENGSGVFGYAASSTGATSGVYGQALSGNGTGVVGYASHADGGTGVDGRTDSAYGTGVRGQATAGSGPAAGVHGTSASAAGVGLRAENTAGGRDLELVGTTSTFLSEGGLVRDTAGSTTFSFDNPTGDLKLQVEGVDVVTTSTDQDALGALSESCTDGQVASWDDTGEEWECVTPPSDTLTGLFASCTTGQIVEKQGAGWVCADDEDTTYTAGNEILISGGQISVDEGPGSGLDADTLDGFHASTFSTTLHGHYGQSWSGTTLTPGLTLNNGEAGGVAISGSSNATTGEGVGVYGYAASTHGIGVHGYADNFSSGFPIGVYGESATGKGVVGSSSWIGVEGRTNFAYGYGVWGDGGGVGLAGYFAGSVHVDGTLSKAGGSFKIDHPLDPENKTLSHSFVESPDMMNVYNGNVVLGADGRATVRLPDYFEALNRDFRYQLTPIGGPGPDLYVAEEIAGNRFAIAGGAPGLKVSWQVTGVRQDPWAEQHRIPVVEDKPDDKRGTFLTPEVYGFGDERAMHSRGRPGGVATPHGTSDRSVAAGVSSHREGH